MHVPVCWHGSSISLFELEAVSNIDNQPVYYVL